MINTGDVVCAIHSIESNIIYLYGYGTYKGVSKINDIVLGHGDIELDSGENISDLECLFGLPESLNTITKNKTVVFIDPKEVRKNETEGFDWKNTAIGFFN